MAICWSDHSLMSVAADPDTNTHKTYIPFFGSDRLKATG